MSRVTLTATNGNGCFKDSMGTPRLMAVAVAHYTASHNHIDCLRFLVKHGSDKEAQDGMGRTLAHMVSRMGWEFVFYLLRVTLTVILWIAVGKHQPNTWPHINALVV